jgi:hypothetical protein
MFWWPSFGLPTTTVRNGNKGFGQPLFPEAHSLRQAALFHVGSVQDSRHVTLLSGSKQSPFDRQVFLPKVVRFVAQHMLTWPPLHGW